MELNENRVQGKWREIKGELQKVWGKLSDDELEKSKGDMKVIGGLIQQKYGELQTVHNKKLAEIFQKMEEKKDAVPKTDEEDLKNIRDFE